MADVAAARREARRRRILENSHNRLQVISGKFSEEGTKESTCASHMSQTFDPVISSYLTEDTAPEHLAHNGSLGIEQETIGSILSRTNLFDGEVTFPSPTTQQQTKNSSTFLQNVIAYKYDIVFLSLFLQIVYAVFAIPQENNYFFVPLIIYYATKSIWFPKQDNSNIANIFLLLSGVQQSQHRLHKMLFIFNFIASFSKDASVFIFSTICIQSFCIALLDLVT